LVFAGTGAIIVDQLTQGKIGVVGIGLVFGLIVLAMISAVGKVSGAHLNPAVTLGFCVMKKHPNKEVAPYVISQIVGALMASCFFRVLFTHTTTTLGMTLPAGSDWQSFVLEFALTFILMAVIIGVSTGDHEEGMFAAVAIGATVGLEAIFAGPICGASMNPARSLAPAVIMFHFQHLWIYCVAPVLGSITAACLYQLISKPGRLSSL